MKNPTSRMILNAIIKSLIFALVFFFFKSCSVKALSVYINGDELTNKTYLFKGSGNTTFKIEGLGDNDSVMASDYNINQYNYYFAAVCTGLGVVSAYYSNISYSDQTFSYYPTNSPCYYPNGVSGIVGYFYGKSDLGLSTSGTSFNPTANFTFYAPDSFSISLLNAGFSDSPFTIDYGSQGIINSNYEIVLKNQEIINQNQNIINQNDQIINGQKDVKDSIDKVDDTMKNDDVDSPDTSKWSGVNASDSPISNMVLMPITLLNAYINGINGSCTSFNLGNLYGTDIIFPCIDISNYLGSTLWNIIDVLFSGFMIFMIGKKFVKIFNDFTNLKDNQVDELYGGGN